MRRENLKRRILRVLRKCEHDFAFHSNCVITDDVNTEPQEGYSWRIDNKEILKELDDLLRTISRIRGRDIYPLRACVNKSRRKAR